ncbi:MAG: helix-turn-helix domain-containing protein [Planctomycetota bacterium]
MDAVWKALSDPTRRALLDAVKDGPRTTGQLADAIEERPAGRIRQSFPDGVHRAAWLVLSRGGGGVHRPERGSGASCLRSDYLCDCIVTC